MGADLYCDSDLILRVLDRLFPDPPLGCDGAHAMTFALSPWFGQQLTQVAVPISFAGAEAVDPAFAKDRRSEEHTSELQSLMRISYAVFCLKNKTTISHPHYHQMQPSKYSTH